MAPLHPFLRKSLFTTKIPMANITMFYYAGVCYTMMQVGGGIERVAWLGASACVRSMLHTPAGRS